MRNLRNLAQSRHNIYYIRFPIPPNFHPHGKKTDLKLSLRTRCPKTALHLSHGLMYLGQRIIDKAAAFSMTYDEIRNLLQEHFSTALAKRKAQFEQEGRLSLMHRDTLLRTIKLSDDALSSHDYTLTSDLTEFLKFKDLDINPSAPEFDIFQNEYTRASRDYFKAVLNHDLSYDEYSFVTEPILSTASSLPALTDKTIKGEIENYLTYAERADGLRFKTLTEMRSHLNLLSDFLGEGASTDITSEQVDDTVHMLLNIPKHSRTKAKLKNLNFDQLINLDAEDPLKKGNMLSNATINKHINNFSGFVNWAVKRKYAQDNHFKGRLLNAEATQQSRVSFTPEQIERIMTEILNADKPERKWGALIARYTGARPEEIAQMHCTDIQEIQGVWCFKFNDDAETKSIKTKAGNRVVPIHSKLLELGILDYVDSIAKLGQERVLYQLRWSKHNGYSRKLGEWFNLSLLPKIGLKAKGVVFYCLRHTATDEILNQGVAIELLRAVLGHEQQGATLNNYAKYRPSQLITAIEKIGAYDND